MLQITERVITETDPIRAKWLDFIRKKCEANQVDFNKVSTEDIEQCIDELVNLKEDKPKLRLVTE